MWRRLYAGCYYFNVGGLSDRFTIKGDDTDGYTLTDVATGRKWYGLTVKKCKEKAAEWMAEEQARWEAAESPEPTAAQVAFPELFHHAEGETD